MSKTKGHTKSITDNKSGHTKMEPYVGKHKGELKFVPEKGQGLGISKAGKLIAKNANRSRKKSERQLAKKEIEKCLNK